MTQPADHGPSSPTRRRFLKSAGATAAALPIVTTSAQYRTTQRQEALAINGGKPAVTAPFTDATTWPKFGEQEEEAVLALVRSPSYNPIAQLEQEWKDLLPSILFSTGNLFIEMTATSAASSCHWAQQR